MIKVSICIPTYKNRSGLERLIKSIVRQSFKSIEIIITDDSDDDCIDSFVASIINSDACLVWDGNNTDIPIRYIHNASPLGPGANWNLSISLAQGEYIKIMHQDDWFTFDDSLENYVKLLDDDPDACLAFSGSRQVSIGEDDKDLSDYYDRGITDEQCDLITEDYRNLFLGGYIGAPSATIYRNVSEKNFDTALRWLIDSDFYMSLLSCNNHFAYTTKPYVSIGVSKGQLTNSCVQDGELVLREHIHLYKKYDLSYSEAYRHKLIAVALEYHFDYDKIKELGIRKAEFNKLKSEFQKKQYLFLFKVLLRKLRLIK